MKVTNLGGKRGFELVKLNIPRVCVIMNNALNIKSTNRLSVLTSRAFERDPIRSE